MWYFFYILFVGSGATLYYLGQEHLSIGIVLVVLVMGLLDWFRKKHVAGQIIEVGSYEWSFVNKENREERKPTRPDDVLHNVIPFPDYVDEKGNGNIYVAGQAGSGKTALLECFAEMYSNPKLVFSSKVFKSDKRDFELGYNWLDVSKHLPNPFLDKPAFAGAFKVAFAIDRQGIMADSLFRLCTTILEKANNWVEFKAELRKLQNSSSSFKSDILQSVSDRIDSLVGGGEIVHLDYDINNVLDFSQLDDTAKVFYIELLLRQVDNECKFSREGKEPVIVIIDEAHRIADSENVSKARASILNFMVREDRGHIKVFCASQNITDVHEDIRANFGSIFTFKTRHKEDLDFLFRISENMKECVANLKKHEFIDVMQEGQNRRVSIMFADVSLISLKKKYHSERRSLHTEQNIHRETEASRVETTQKNMEDTGTEFRSEQKGFDYEKRVLDLLENKPENISQLAKVISAESGETQDAVKLKLRNKVIPRLVDKDSISSMPLVTHKFKGKRTPVYYFKNDKQLSNFHVLITDLVKKECKKNGVAVIRESYVGIQACDLETKSQFIEVESGLKHSYADLVERIEKASKPVLVVVPNLEVSLRYEDKLKDQLNRCTITTLVELKDKLIKD